MSPEHNYREAGTKMTKESNEMVLQTMVAVLAMGLAVLSLLFMGRWV